MIDRLPVIRAKQWLNTRSLQRKDLAGNVVLVHFWNYTNEVVLGDLSYYRKLTEKYSNLNFKLVGIHTPEYSFEESPEYVQKALERYQIDWPIALDNDWRLWEKFENEYWPTRYLFKREGNLVHQHVGDGNYQETETLIQEELRRHTDQDLPALEPASHEHSEQCFVATPEMYGGYKYGDIVNERGFIKDVVAEYGHTSELPENSMALSGTFLSQPDYLETVNGGSTIYVNFTGNKVNAVLEAVGDEAEVEVTVYNSEVRDEILKQTAIGVTWPRSYELILGERVINAVMKLSCSNSKIRFYTCFYSSCTTP